MHCNMSRAIKLGGSRSTTSTGTIDTSRDRLQECSPDRGNVQTVTDLSHTVPIDEDIPSSVLPPMTLTIVLGPTVADATVINFFPTAVVQPRSTRLGWTRARVAIPLKATGVTPRPARRATNWTAEGVACWTIEDVNGWTAGQLGRRGA